MFHDKMLPGEQVSVSNYFLTAFGRIIYAPPEIARGTRYHTTCIKKDGDVAQLGERGVRNAEARGSIPLISTKKGKRGQALRENKVPVPFLGIPRIMCTDVRKESFSLKIFARCQGLRLPSFKAISIVSSE